MSNDENTKQYIGCSVYAEFSGYEIILTTENGLPCDPSNRIVLDQKVVKSLFDYAKHFGFLEK